MSNIGIIGYGFVGQAVEYGFKDKHDVFVHDKYKPGLPLNSVLERSQVLFICLPTPFDEKKLQIDLSICDEIMRAICPDVAGRGIAVVIKSTVVPGTTERYSKIYPDVPFAFNPEFLTEANYLEDFVNTDRIIIGSDNDWAAQTVTMLYRSVPNFEKTPILRMSPTAAEVVKYQCNVLLATKVALSNVFYDVCQRLNVQYSDIERAVGMDHRIGPSHLKVTTERGFGGKCFVKDLGALIDKCKELDVDNKLLKEIFNYNLRIRKVKDWREIAGATVGGRDYSR